MNHAIVHELIDRAFAKTIKFPAILQALAQEEIESYHVDFLRREYRYYAADGASYVTAVPQLHASVARHFAKDRLADVNRRVQAGQAWYPDFVKEAAAAGCAYYIVYVNGRKVRYFGRDGDEYIQYLPDATLPAAAHGIARSCIRSVDIQAPLDRVFTFLANPLNWPRYAVVNLRAVSPGEDGWCNAVTTFGEGRIKVSPVEELGILDHVWQDPQACWTVYSRVVPNGCGATVTFTLFQPSIMNDAQFDAAMAQMNVEMAELKAVMEAADSAQ